MSEEYEIVIKSNATGTENQELKQNQPKQLSVSELKNNIVFAQSMRVAQAGFNFVVSNYGNLTGDHIAQNSMQKIMATIGNVSSVASGFIVGGVAGGVVAAIGIGISEATKIAQEQIQINNQNRNANEFNTRVGGIVSRGNR